MVLAVAYDDAKDDPKTKQIRRSTPRPDQASVKTSFFGSPDNPDAPHACLNHFGPGRATFSGTHFHVNDQFQVLVNGKGKIGRHDLAPYCVHFTRAYTPYGPLVSDTGTTGFSFFVMRAHYDPGAQHVPEELDQLKQASDRRPWQITRAVTFPALLSGTSAAETLLQAIPDIQDEQGLAAYALSMKPNTKIYAPDHSHGDGQYLVVVKGSVWHDHKEHQALALVFVYPEEGPFEIHAGSQGLEALVLNFPQVKRRALQPKAPSLAAGFKKWQCALCEFTYDEAVGMPEEGMPAGTRWQDVPETWGCPDCSAAKADFQMIELEN